MRSSITVCLGLLFGIGLLLSGMTDPAKVLGFLDLAGAWDPSLALVMIGAIAAALPFFTLARRRTRSLLETPMQLPATRGLDRRLILGSLMFGIGWGLAGICPGPAIVLTGMLVPKGVVFLSAMLVGMAAHERLALRQA